MLWPSGWGCAEARRRDTKLDYEAIADIVDQKAFAQKAVLSRCSGALFSFRAKKTESIDKYMREMRIDSMRELLGYRETELKNQENVDEFSI